MELRRLGRTDIQVSAIGLGVMTFGSQTDEAESFRILDAAHGAAITLFDTAENYPSPLSAETQGRSEEILGRWIAARGRRDAVTIATKVTGPENAAGNLSYIRGADRRLDRANIRAAVEGSLRRLRTDRIDLYQLHWPERPISTLGRWRFSHLPDAPEQIPVEETLAALGELVDEGKVLAVGVCNETPWGVMRFLAASASGDGLPRIASIQNSYSLLDRQFEIGLAEVAMREQVGLIAYSPLAGGVLTGKYGGQAKAIAGTRSTQPRFVEARLSASRLEATQAYADIARAAGLPLAAMALAFVRQQPFTTSLLMAARTLEQLEANLAGAALTLDKEVTKAINAVHDRRANP